MFQHCRPSGRDIPSSHPQTSPSGICVDSGVAFFHLVFSSSSSSSSASLFSFRLCFLSAIAARFSFVSLVLSRARNRPLFSSRPTGFPCLTSSPPLHSVAIRTQSPLTTRPFGPLASLSSTAAPQTRFARAWALFLAKQPRPRPSAPVSPTRQALLRDPIPQTSLCRLLSISYFLSHPLLVQPRLPRDRPLFAPHGPSLNDTATLVPVANFPFVLLLPFRPLSSDPAGLYSSDQRLHD